MNKIAIVMLFAIGVYTPTHAKASNSAIGKPNFLCVADRVAGLQAKADWAVANFNPMDVKLVVKELTPEQATLFNNSQYGLLKEKYARRFSSGS